MSPSPLGNFDFRREYGRLVAVLSRRVGVEHVEAVEDAVQSALLTALERWTRGERPDNPSGWLYRVAHNDLVGRLRREAGRQRILDRAAPDGPRELGRDLPPGRFEAEVEDDLLRMLFVACDPALPPESQLVFTLKTLCGFDTKEIAHRLFLTEANVYKRLARARACLREQPVELTELDPEGYAERLPAVHTVLYLLFTEGHLSSHAELALRKELCDEAIRLATLLAEHPVGHSPAGFALLALMHLHAARMTAREGPAGELRLLEEQDRTAWDRESIRVGLAWLARSAEGEAFTRYHAEAGIAAEHCLAPSLEKTRWDRVTEFYGRLERIAPSPMHRLNRALAVAEAKDPEAGLAVLEGFEPPTWLEGSYTWSAVLADLHARAGHAEPAARHREAALQLAPSEAVRALLQRRLHRTSERGSS